MKRSDPKERQVTNRVKISLLLLLEAKKQTSNEREKGRYHISLPQYPKNKIPPNSKTQFFLFNLTFSDNSTVSAACVIRSLAH